MAITIPPPRKANSYALFVIMTDNTSGHTRRLRFPADISLEFGKVEDHVIDLSVEQWHLCLKSSLLLLEIYRDSFMS